MSLRSVLVSTLALFLLAAPAQADVIRLASGGKVRGQIVKETSREVVVRTLGGTTVVPRGDIESIERGETAEQRYEKRLAKIDAQDPEAHYTLGLWLKSIRAARLARIEFERTIELDPEHTFARQELGYVRQGGEWSKVSAKRASSGAAPEARTRRKPTGGGLELPASAPLNEALSGLRSKKPETRSAAWSVLADADGEVERLLASLEPDAPKGAGPRPAVLRAALRDVAPESEGLQGDALRPHLETYVDGAQRAAVTAALEGFSRAVLRRHARAVKKLEGQIKDYRPGQTAEKRTQALARWAKARDAALTVIFDKAIYPDANHGRSGQPTVDEHVDAVRAAWAPFDRLVQKDVSKLLALSPEGAEDLLKGLELETVRLSEVRAALSERGGVEVPHPAVASVYTVLLTYRAGNVELALASAGSLSPWEHELLRRLRDERVRAFNKAFTSKNPHPYGKQPSGQEVEQVRITNDYRILMGRLALEIDPRLVQSARGHSADMTRMGFFAHESPIAGKRSPTERMGQAGYGGGGGENISLGSTSPKATHIAWYNSSGHHRNILSPGWQCMGSGKDGKHWTQNFGARGGLPR